MNIATTLRKKVAGLSIVAIVASMFAANVAVAQTTGNIFTDVPPEAWFAPYVNQLAEDGIADTSFDEYRPGDLVNRAEMAKFAVMAAGYTVETAPEAPFKDVALGQWYTDVVYTAEKNGIVSGDKDDAGNLTGYYRPGDSLNRAEAAKIIVNAFQFMEDTAGGPHFPDVSSSDWFYIFVETSFNNGVISGYPDGTYKPGNNINRAEAAKMLSIAMGGGMVEAFKLDSAAAASETKVELIFSMNVNETEAADFENYMIEDASGSELAVSDAEVVAPDTVHLTTASQEEGKVYYVTVTGVTSDAGESLSVTDSVSFLGYGTDVSGGALTVSLSSQTPVDGSIPSGATGVVFTCWDFQAGGDDVIVKSLHVKRVGPGKETDFNNVYLYNGDERLSTGRSINSETQNVEFNNINQEVIAGENIKLCLVADLVAGAAGGVHAFELNSADDVVSNTSDMQGSFPLRGEEQLITSAVVGTTTISYNGSLDEVTIGQKGARIAQFELEANGEEDQELERIALYVRGSISANDLANMKLYIEGEDEAIAETDGVGSSDLATFVLEDAFKIGRGQRKIFYVEADLAPGRNGDTIKVYLDESTDLLVTGVTYGYGTKVKFVNYNGTDPSNYSLVNVKGSDFNIAFTGPAATDLATGQKAAKCLSMTLTNASGEAVEIKDWPISLEIINTITGDGGLHDGTNPNYTLIKLARINEDGTIGGSLLGPSEIDTADSKTAPAPILLRGTATIDPGESIETAVVLDLRSGNNDMNGDKLKCTLAKGVSNGLAGVSDAIRDLNGDQLGAESITPASSIIGNTHTVTTSALTVALASTPSTQSYTKGTTAAELAGFAFTSGSALGNTIKSITVSGQVDGDSDDSYTAVGDGIDDDGAAPDGTVALADIIDSGVALYNGDTKVSDFKNINYTTGKVIFNNLDIKVEKSQTLNLILKGNVSNSAPFGSLNDRVKFSIQNGTDIITIDQNGQNVDSGSIQTNDAKNATSQVAMTIVKSGSGQVAKSPTLNPTAVAGSEMIEVGKWSFSSVNEDPTLKDLDFLVLNGSSASIQNVKLYKGSACTEQVGSITGYTPKSPSGIIEVRDLNEIVDDATTYTLCAKALTGEVKTNGSQPVTNSNVGLALLNVTEVSSGSGENVAQNYVAGATQAAGSFLTAAIDAVVTTVPVDALGSLAVGQTIQVEGEMMLITAIIGSDLTVIRGFGATTATSHIAGAEVRISQIATQVTAATSVESGDIYYSVTDGAYFLCVDPAAAGVANVCDNVADVQELFGTTVGFVTTPAANDAVWKLHGPISKLFRAIPEVTKTAAKFSDAPDTDFVLLDLTINAIGDQVKFDSVNGNQLEVTIEKNTTTGGAASTCDLVKVAPGTNQMLHENVAIANSLTQVITFTFDDNALTVNPGEVAKLEVKCNASQAISTEANATISAALVSEANVITWDDSSVTDTNITGAGKFIIPTKLQGNTAANGS